MTDTATKPTGGSLLKAVRLEKGIDLSTVSNVTKIGLESLERLENDDYTHLPSEVYVKGFVRAYAQVIGLDADEAIECYMAGIRRRGHNTDNTKAGVTASKPFWLRFVGIIVFFLALIVTSIIVFKSRF